MSFVIFDTEYTSWKGCQEHGWQGNQKKEIVQISAIKVNDNLEIISEFNTLCKPLINPILSDYFIELTHITNEQIGKLGKPFKQVYADFVEFVDNNSCYSHSWGSDFSNKSDGKIIEENLGLYDIPAQKKIAYYNIAPVFEQLYKENRINVTSQSSGQIAQILDLNANIKKLGLNPHNALYDVYSILVGLKHFFPRSLEIMLALKK